MKKISAITFIMAILVFAMFTSCKKVEGPQGPAGPAGTNGNANVKTTVYSNITMTISADPQIAVVDITNADITQDILDNGDVLVSTSNDQQVWYSIPRALPNPNALNTEYSFSYSLNKVTIEFATYTHITTAPIIPYVKITAIAGN